MPISLSKALDFRNTITIPLGRDSLNFKYKPSLYNQANLEQVRRNTTPPRPVEEMGAEERAQWEAQQTYAGPRFLMTLDPEWDVTGEDGKPLPVTEDLLVQLGLEIQQALINGIVERINRAGAKPKD